MTQLVPQNAIIVKNIEQLHSQFKFSSDGKDVPEEICDTPEKIEAYQIICSNLPKYIACAKYECSPNGQQQCYQMIAGDPLSYKNSLIGGLNKILPPQDVDVDEKPVDKQKEAETNALAGTLVLGVNLLTDLGSGEEAITAQKDEFHWLLKKTEIIEEIIEDGMFNGEIIYTQLMAGVQKLDPIYFVKWQNLSYTDCTWEPASLIRKQDETDSKIKDFERFNRSLDNNSRQKMMGFGYAHK